MNWTGIQGKSRPARDLSTAAPHHKFGPLTSSMDTQALKFRSTGRTHVGKVRSCNEDAFVEHPGIGLWAVSDGMGGLRAGDVASGHIVSALRELPLSSDAKSIEPSVVHALQEANKELFQQGSAKSERATMGATVTAFIVDGESFSCVWVGDSRLYRIRDGKIAQLTRDHRYIQELLDAGVLSEVEARQHPRRNVITRAIGVEKNVELDSIVGSINRGDLFVLSTDGVTSVCEDEDLAEIIEAAENINAAADVIVDRCLEGGAPDNLTLILIAVD